jgi:hypothetical protein
MYALVQGCFPPNPLVHHGIRSRLADLFRDVDAAVAQILDVDLERARADRLAKPASYELRGRIERRCPLRPKLGIPEFIQVHGDLTQDPALGTALGSILKFRTRVRHVSTVLHAISTVIANSVGARVLTECGTGHVRQTSRAPCTGEMGFRLAFGLGRFARGWCPGPDSNRHAFRRPVLSGVCTPVPPPGRSHLSPAPYVLCSVRRRLRMAIGAEQAEVCQLIVVAIAIHMIEFQGDRQAHPRNIPARRTTGSEDAFANQPLSKLVRTANLHPLRQDLR